MRTLEVTNSMELWCLTPLSTIFQLSGADPGFQVRGGAHLKKLRRAEGGVKMFGVFRVKNHDFTPKNHIFPILGRTHEIFGVFHVKIHDFKPKKSYFFPILGGARAGCAPPP